MCVKNILMAYNKYLCWIINARGFLPSSPYNMNSGIPFFTGKICLKKLVWMLSIMSIFS